MTFEVGTEQQLRWLKGFIAAIFILNVIDGVLTVFWVVSGQASEANPLMDELLNLSPPLFMLGKLSLVGLGSVLLWRHRERPGVVVSIFMLFLVYYWLLLYHLQAVGFTILDALSV